MKILICEDDDVLLFWLAKKLLARKLDVHSTQNGDDALDTYRRNRPFDFVLTDYLFPPGQTIKNGLYLVKAIRGIEPGQCIILHTSEEGLRAPCPVLFKPYRLEKLLRLLKLPAQSLLF